MAKRLTDTDKWEDTWFQELDKKYRFFYLYLLDKCDHAGIWKVNMPLACFQLSDNYSKDELLTVLNGRVVELTEEYWYIIKFIDYQYGKLNPKSNVHKGVYNRLKKFEGLLKPYISVELGIVLPTDQQLSTSHKGLANPMARDMDKDKDKDKVKDKEPLTFKEVTQDFLENFDKVVLE